MTENIHPYLTEAYQGVEAQRSSCRFLTPLEVSILKAKGAFDESRFLEVSTQMRQLLEKVPSLHIELEAPDGAIVSPDDDYDDEFWGTGVNHDEWDGTP